MFHARSSILPGICYWMNEKQNPVLNEEYLELGVVLWTTFEGRRVVAFSEVLVSCGARTMSFGTSSSHA